MLLQQSLKIENKHEIQIDDLWNLSKERLSHVFFYLQHLLDNVFLTTSFSQHHFMTSFSQRISHVILTTLSLHTCHH